MKSNGKRLWLYLVLAVAVWIWTIWYPVHNRPIQMATLTAILAVIFIVAMILPNRARKFFMIGFVCLSAVFVISIVIGDREVDEAAFRNSFVDELRKQVGKTYVWGGEGFAGVDCSGLPRRAFRIACWKRGFLDLNPGLWRLAIQNWAFDASASAMKEEYRGETRNLGVEAASISTLNSNKVAPGDLAVTENGIHMLAYLGENRWIQADPGRGLVIIEDARTSENHWLNTPVEFLSWSILAK